MQGNSRSCRAHYHRAQVKPESNLVSPGPNKSSLSSSSEEAGLKMVENDAAGAGAGGNMMAQFLGKGLQYSLNDTS